jgi:glyoxylase-like metal-dependent hydrolase (beta-lactamase superfamily II)
MVEIVPGVHQIDGVNANCYLILEGDGSLTLVDTGMSKSGKKILDYVQSALSKKPSDVKTIVLTHAHLDHVRGALEVKNATGGKIAIHEADADFLSQKKKMVPPGGVFRILFAILGPFFSSPPVEADQKLHENDRIGNLTVIHTPGHTPGSISLYDSSKKVMFVGDAVIYSKGEMRGPPKQFTQNMNEAMQSVQKISEYDFETMLSGHGEPLKSPNASKAVKEFYTSRK